MSKHAPMIPNGEPLWLHSLVTATEQGIASRVLARAAGGNVTLFAFDAGQELEEHTTPFEALVMVLEGTVTLTVGGRPVEATPGTIVRMPPGVPHAVAARDAARMLLIMLRIASPDKVWPREVAVGMTREQQPSRREEPALVQAGVTRPGIQLCR